jgi:CBS domain-containing protein
MTQIAELIQGRPLYHAESSESVREVVKQMADLNIGAIAILEKGALAGVFSERDLMTRVVVPGLDPNSTPIAEVMTRNLLVAEPLDDIPAALQKMYSLGCRHLPVVDRGTLVGMISLRDLLQIDRQKTRERANFLRELVTYSPDYES